MTLARFLRAALTVAAMGMALHVVAAPSGARISATVAERAQRGQPVDVMIVLDDTLEQRQLRSSVGPLALHRRLGRDEHARVVRARRALLGALKVDVLAAAAEPDVEVLRDYDQLPVMHARVRSARALENLRRQGRIRSIDAVVAVRPALTESLARIQQPAALAAGHVGAGTTVAVLDTGVDYARAAFGSCSSPGGSCKVAVALDFATPDGARDTGSFHGTNVAGIVLGVAPGARVAALDVFEADGLAYSNVIINAINWCIANKATYNIAAINMSLGGGRHFAALAPTDAWGTAIANAVAAGIVVVAATGNNGYSDSISAPAAYANVVSVGATHDAGGSTDQVTSFSNSAPFMTMLAPGSMISAAGITMQGTSQATPHVAGAAAVLRASYPNDTVSALVTKLKLGATVTDGRNGVSKPLLDLQASLAIPPETYRITISRGGKGSGTVTGNAGNLNCGSTCSADITNGASVTLKALHGAGSQFVGWSGACTGGEIGCTVPMTAARSVTATFAASTAEDFLGGGALPPGWATASGASAGWAPTSSGPYVGTHALKAATVGHGQVAGISVGGSFRAGDISFARRVSSEAGQDQLQFFIDGQLQDSWSGEVPWGMVHFPISAGQHTLTWRYTKNGSGSAGADSAWIDSVNLPWAATSAREARHDFNGDGRADILWRHDVSGAVTLWHMDGATRLSGSGRLPNPSDKNWRVAGTGDFDGDGRADILWRHGLHGGNSVWFMDGLVRTSIGKPPTIADVQWEVVGVADFDGDGKDDVQWRHRTSRRNLIWLMDGATRRSSTELPNPSDPNWQMVGARDFDGDGKADLLLRNGANGATVLWTMDGAVRTATARLPDLTDLNWRVAGTGDLDGDGKSDIVWRNGSTRAVMVWLMNGAVRLASATVGTPSDAGWRVAAVADLNADGKADILLRHASTGALSAWTMNGTSRTGVGQPPGMGDLGWKTVAPRAYPN
ncbi:MAG: FG-GAP repeat protein [Burkholderiaceae bacterium]|nr:FG-GAP repeat protein [Burkholderiaceae bacterium]